MRLWSISPNYLDSKGLVALWREGLLAQKVLAGNTTGYKNHPQLDRFKNTNNPIGAIATYLRVIIQEAESRGYNFDKTKILNNRLQSKIKVTTGQLDYELSHLKNKLGKRDPQRLEYIRNIKEIESHSLFYRVQGGVEKWEVIQ